MAIEYFPIVDEEGNQIGKVSRSECHSGSFLLHPVVHLHVLNQEGKLYLQKRSETKDIQPGKWDTSVGGHVDFGESIEQALKREVREELGINSFEPVFIHRYRFVSEIECELVHSFYCIYDDEIYPDPDEISDGQFMSLYEIKQQLGKNHFTPNFETEFEMLIKQGLLPIK